MKLGQCDAKQRSDNRTNAGKVLDAGSIKRDEHTKKV